MADYVPVAVEHAIEPDTGLTFVGDVICFSTHLLNQDGLDPSLPSLTSQPAAGLGSSWSPRASFFRLPTAEGLSEKDVFVFS